MTNMFTTKQSRFSTRRWPVIRGVVSAVVVGCAVAIADARARTAALRLRFGDWIHSNVIITFTSFETRER